MGLCYIVAIACVGVFYLDTLLPWRMTPVLTAIALGALAARVVLSIRDRPEPIGSPRNLSIGLLLAALGGFLMSTVTVAVVRGYTINEWGVFALQFAVPAMLIFAPRQDDLIKAVLQVCLVVALVDAAANFLAVAGLFELPEMSARVDEFGRRQRYPGLAGNTHAAGLVAFFAACYVASLARVRVTPYLVLAGLVLLASLFLIDARRYLVLTVLAVPLIYHPWSRKVPLLPLAVSIAGFLLLRTFTADYADLGNKLRAMLLEDGWHRAMQNPILGEGVVYRAAGDLIATYMNLSMAGVTESQALDLAIAYGVLPTALFLLACAIAIAGNRDRVHPPVVILTLMTAELFFGGALTGPLGAIVFFACLTVCQKDARLVQVSAKTCLKPVTPA
ncbi:hypothetical protein SAMN05192570_0281 [Brevundimonas viscosa]|uniref:O-Antigen ligase n=1 Tax=Brevundimonas viscosa TaxID=871741 RepID=A0A1I6NPK7_9CAUL|nr:hypothetical protein SAMN05192570_0281 [Brevundimonas viscosa]